MREPTAEEWAIYHDMVAASQQLLRRRPDGAFDPASVKAARSGVENALAWLEALRR